MLFNSYIFIFAFLPVTWIIFWSLNAIDKKSIAFLALIIASWIFYAYWKPIYLVLLLGSISVNFLTAELISKRTKHAKLFTICGVLFNLTLLGYFKYTLFFTDILDHVFNFTNKPSDIFLPLGISFFTFQQITYLCDLYQEKLKKASLPDYALFVSFFPQLIAGPIVHAKEMIPQFTNFIGKKIFWSSMATGLSIFIVGLFKKVVIADNLALYATPVFNNALQGNSVAFFESWSGALAYTFQLYFDFSGYSDMAIGLALMFGIVLPINFLSPYKATSIIDFWRRWHITMSRFFRDYVYIPLGGNKVSRVKQIRNLFLTMFVAGLWHGAGWTFVVWGMIHGIFLIINHIYIGIREKIWPKLNIQNWGYKILTHIITMLCVVFAWVIFRAENFDAAKEIMASMVGMNDIILPKNIFERFADFGTDGLLRFARDGEDWLNNSYWCVPWIIGAYIISITLPASVEFFGVHKDRNKKQTKPFYSYKVIPVIIAAMAIIACFSMQRVSEFLYFQF